ncbi:hypothetical protein H310_13633 [Aphanomyces invadans]|uniref:Uncharacterized protein n=1 Tax=Aphanomyces invadans TaxID=157072 RepID=A0A024TEI8_9STRA|nr:hypothetical protein H310_13633 [Aphanomyces invadans]ETV92001.1 hypothetical protein H310_13633 [Aphanomyces invadans]|eukprot:XP_008879425.1 hypothetical protein H310_13633 [Aphanomyces invadans]
MVLHDALRKKVNGAPGEKIKQRSCKSKQYLLKVMFMTAVARPRWDEDKNECVRRDVGTPIMKTVAVTRDTYKAMLIDNVIPAIRSKWPHGESKKVKI